MTARGRALRGALAVGQSGGPTPVVNASLAGVIAEAQATECFTAVYGLLNGIEGALGGELLDLSGQSPETLSLLALTPAAALGSCRHKLTEADHGRILDLFRVLGVRHFVYIGGNDSMDTCDRIAAAAAHAGYELQVIGVPKTIDNDLAGTDHSPGFGSAARFLALAARDTGRDLESMRTFDDVTILETMGRHAGWLAASAALGKALASEDEAPHLIYLPEIPFDERRFLDDVARIHSRLGRAYVVVAEVVRDAAGQFVGRQALEGRSGPPVPGSGVSTDAFGHAVLARTPGVAAYLTDLVRESLGLRARFLRPGLIGRALSACASETDRREALAVGREAVRCLAQGETGQMVSLERVSDEPYDCGTGLVPLGAVANAEKLLPRDFLDAGGTMVTEAFSRYALPLIDGPLPSLARLQGPRVQVGPVAG